MHLLAEVSLEWNKNLLQTIGNRPQASLREVRRKALSLPLEEEIMRNAWEK